MIFWVFTKFLIWKWIIIWLRDKHISNSDRLSEWGKYDLIWNRWIISKNMISFIYPVIIMKFLRVIIWIIKKLFKVVSRQTRKGHHFSQNVSQIHIKRVIFRYPEQTWILRNCSINDMRCGNRLWSRISENKYTDRNFHIWFQ